MTSASETLATVIPAAPASNCSLAIVGILCVLTWGLSFTPRSLAILAIFSMFLLIFGTSTKRRGVSTLFSCSLTLRALGSIVVPRRSPQNTALRDFSRDQYEEISPRTPRNSFRRHRPAKATFLVRTAPVHGGQGSFFIKF